MHVLLAALVALSTSQRSQIDAVVERVMREHHVPGLSLGIARDGVVLYARGYGMRDAARRLAAGAATRYPVGSIAKQFAAALALQDTAAGTLALGAPIGRYFPSASAPLSGITVGQLLAQTGGIATDAGAGVRSPEAALDSILQSAPAAAPGTAWIYSNANYVLVEAILQNVAGAAYGTLLRDRICGPLKMTATAYAATTSAGDDATGYAWRDGWVPASAGAARAFEAGNVTSNVLDLLHWLEALRSGRVVPAAQFSEMTSTARLSDGTPTNYGYGFFLPNWFGYRTIEHPGYVDGFSGVDALVLDDGLEI
ncbi:MAG TPA: serine hydrolase domain-containing protein, partial [Candidatus Tumulicola sp.]|nr:serine hydrolase domain-containing protein [Candidatus Tumulicola sp.]